MVRIVRAPPTPSEMSETEFSSSVEFGIRLSKRIILNTEDGSLSSSTLLKPPKPVSKMENSTSISSLDQSISGRDYLPTSPMVYAVITDPSIVDNPDIRSYQPYVHGRCNPPALIPLHMYGIEVESDCYMDTGFVSVSGSWMLHSVAGNRSCDCCVAIPMGEKGSVLGFEIEVPGKSYKSQLIVSEDDDDDDDTNLEGLAKSENGSYLKPHIFTLKIPKLYGGSKISIKARWTQKLLYNNGQFCLNFPFSFPSYVNPVGKFRKKEKISLNVNSVTDKQIICKSCSHSLKETRRQAGRLAFVYDKEVYTWSRSDFEFTYAVSSSDIFGELLLQSPALHDFDQRDIFSLYLFPGDIQNKKVFRKKVVFLVDISGSMRGAPITNVTKAVSASLCKLHPEDSFNILAFNTETYWFSSSMELATEDAVENATQWMSTKIIAEGSTNIMLPLSQAVDMLSQKGDTMSLILLITDGAVENERDICNFVKELVDDGEHHTPRISTLGIGTYCNHYFLQMLAQISRGYYDTAYQADSIPSRFESLFTSSSSIILANINFGGLELLKSLTIYPSSTVQDLSLGSPLIISGRCRGDFPNSVKVQGTLANMNSFTMDLKVRKTKEMPLDRIFAGMQIESLTAQTWLSNSKQLKDQVARMSVQTGIPSEFTHMVLFQTYGRKHPSDLMLIEKPKHTKIELEKAVATGEAMVLQSLGVGFGDLKKTAENAPPGITVKVPDATDLLVKATSNCCNTVLDRICCMCFINACSKLNDQCAIVASQICVLFACCQCVDCCFDLCEPFS